MCTACDVTSAILTGLLNTISENDQSCHVPQEDQPQEPACQETCPKHGSVGASHPKTAAVVFPWGVILDLSFM